MRISQTQRQRTKESPLVLGPFDQLSIRNLTGSLGPKNKVVSGGYGGGTYNHWFRIDISADAWIILAKGGRNPNYINVSAYDLNLTPIEGRSPFDKDSISETIDGEVYYPYVGNVMNRQSDLYNNFDPNRLDRGDLRYYPLRKGSYLLCISSTRNENIDYEVAFVVEFPITGFDLLLEDYALMLYEDGGYVVADTTPNYVENDRHTHSLSEWDEAWQRERQQGVPFPAILVPLATQP